MYTIGESPLEEMISMVQHELNTMNRPMVPAILKRGYASELERYCSLILSESLKNTDAIIERVNDACLADMTYKTNKNEIDCMGIQIKTTKGPTTEEVDGIKQLYWTFEVTKKPYDGMLIVLRSIRDGEMWMIPYTLLRELYKARNIAISTAPRSRIIWDQFKVRDDKIVDKLKQYYSSEWIKHLTEEQFNIPVTVNNQKEQNTRKRLSKYIKLDSPPLENMSYDVVFKNIRIQEKNAAYARDRHLGQSTQIKRGRKSRPYEEDDFDALVIHLAEPYDDVFYCIPMKKLIENGFIKTGDNKCKKTMMLYPPGTKKSKFKQRDEWANEFILRYDYLDLEEKILKIISIY